MPSCNLKNPTRRLLSHWCRTRKGCAPAMPCIGRPPCRFPRGSCADFCLTGKFLDHRLAHRKLLDLAGYSGRKTLDEADVARSLVMRDPVLTESADPLLVESGAGLGD